MKVWRCFSLTSGFCESPMELPLLGCSEPTSGEGPQLYFQNHLEIACMGSHQCVPVGQNVTLPSHLGPWEGSLQGYTNFLHLSSLWPLEPAPLHEQDTLSDVLMISQEATNSPSPVSLPQPASDPHLLSLLEKASCTPLLPAPTRTVKVASRQVCLLPHPLACLPHHTAAAVTFNSIPFSFTHLCSHIT